MYAERGGHLVAKLKQVQLGEVRPHEGEQHGYPWQQAVHVAPAAVPQAAGKPKQCRIDVARMTDNQILDASLKNRPNGNANKGKVGRTQR
ncbi:hypothetical protein D3C84_1104520 [compost metagenome]